jgi:hypothetical protein
MGNHDPNSKVFYEIVVDNGFVHSTPRDGITYFESLETAQEFADELINSGETHKAFVQTVDGYGIPNDSDPEIYEDYLKRYAARHLTNADEEADARQLQIWRQKNTLLQTQKVLLLDEPAEFKRDFILILLATLGMSQIRQDICRKLDPEIFLFNYAATMANRQTNESREEAPSSLIDTLNPKQ